MGAAIDEFEQSMNMTDETEGYCLCIIHPQSSTKIFDINNIKILKNNY